jgi:hypothetical protein
MKRDYGPGDRVRCLKTDISGTVLGVHDDPGQIFAARRTYRVTWDDGIDESLVTPDELASFPSVGRNADATDHLRPA